VKLNISLVYLHPYSPDLNPIENVWKGVKSAVSERAPPNVEVLKEVIAEVFRKTYRINIFCKKVD